MSGLARQENALNLSQGFPDFNCSPKLVELVNKYMKAGMNQYAPMRGVQSLLDILAEKTEALYGAVYHPEKEITVMPGGTLGIYAAITAVVRENDEVVIIEPAYDSYVPAIELNGGKAVHVELRYPDYTIDWDELKKVISYRTKMIIINTPHNPTGSTLSEEGIQQLIKITKDTDIVILSDEVYEHIIFDNEPHLSMARYPELAERSFIISSFGKTYHTTGWKMGYVVAPENLTKELRKVYQFMAFSANTPIQYALADMLSNPNSYLELSGFYQQKRDLFQEYLKESRFEVLPCKGSYFQLLHYSAISDEGDFDFAQRLTREKKIASIPISVFYRKKTDSNVLRFCFAKSDDTLKKAAEILCKI